MKTINVDFMGIELYDGQTIEIIYTPNQTQVLQEGRMYKIKLKFPGKLTSTLSTMNDGQLGCACGKIVVG
jgi:hypothetical protein